MAPHDDSATALDVFLALNQAYFMGFFFLIAGYFTPGALDRKGAGRFARDRLVRLGIPLLLFVIVVRAVVDIPGWLLVLFREPFAAPRPSFLTANAFAVSVLHALVLIALGVALSGLVAPAIVKAVVLGAIGLPLCWAFAAAVRALPGAKKVL